MDRSKTALSLLLAPALLFTQGCRTPPQTEALARMESAQRGLESDPGVAARSAEVEAALARERAVTPIDDVQVRLRQEYDEQLGIGLTTRVPVPDPKEVGARRAARRAETEGALTRLEGAALARRAELCFASVERASYYGRRRIYESWATLQNDLLEWSRAGHESGALGERAAARFELASRIRLATRSPGPAPGPLEPGDLLPALAPPVARLVTSQELLSGTLRAGPGVAYHEAMSERYRALSERARARQRPWFRFVDLTYEPVSSRGNKNEVGGQIALTVPIGDKGAEVERFESLVRSARRDADQELAERMQVSVLALREIDSFEGRIDQWSDLTELADSTERVAEHWWRERLAKPADVSDLLDQVHTARVAILEAREQAGLAGCTLLATTGVSVESWPRQ